MENNYKYFFSIRNDYEFNPKLVLDYFFFTSHSAGQGLFLEQWAGV